MTEPACVQRLWLSGHGISSFPLTRWATAHRLAGPLTSGHSPWLVELGGDTRRRKRLCDMKPLAWALCITHIAGKDGCAH
jgi:hypothetical protein